jgi:hypothetical protein
MYKVEWKDKDGVIFKEEVVDLSKALVFAKELGILVTINGGGMEIVGRFGVDAVVNGVCPDGVKYDWNKANRIGRTRRKQ